MKTANEKANEHLEKAETHLKKMREILREKRQEKVYNSLKHLTLLN